MAKIRIEFLNGRSTVSVKGVKGKSCTDITKAVEEALGKVEKKEFTKEYGATEKPQVQNIVQ